MIKITNKFVENTVFFPRNELESSETYTLKLFSPVTGDEYNFEATDEGGYNDFYEFKINFSSVNDGEFVYLINGKEFGLILIGENYEAKREEKKSYNNDNKIIQYNG